MLFPVSLTTLTPHVLQRLQFSEMSINQAQCGVDDAPELMVDVFDQDRSKLAKKGKKQMPFFLLLLFIYFFFFFLFKKKRFPSFQ